MRKPILSQDDFKKGMTRLMVNNPALTLGEDILHAYEIELQHLSEEDFLGSIDNVCNDGPNLYIRANGLPGVSIPALIKNNVPEKRRSTVTFLPPSRERTEEEIRIAKEAFALMKTFTMPGSTRKRKELTV